MNFNRETVSVKAGDTVFGFSGEKFKAVGTDLQYYYICFEGSRAEELFLRFGVCALNRLFKGFEGMLPFWQENILSMLHPLLYKAGNAGYNKSIPIYAIFNFASLYN